MEAPERFQAIQSYRATMAVLRQQRTFVHSLLNAGVVEELEHDQLQGCVSDVRCQETLDVKPAAALHQHRIPMHSVVACSCMRAWSRSSSNNHLQACATGDDSIKVEQCGCAAACK